jgi:hypothetical protein
VCSASAEAEERQTSNLHFLFHSLNSEFPKPDIG